jgi:membrane protein
VAHWTIPGLGGLSVGELLRRFWRSFQDHAVTDTAAELAYYYLFSLFPLLFFLVTLAAYLPIQDAVDEALVRMADLMPSQAIGIVTDQVQSLVREERPRLLGAGVLFALWSASRGVDALRRALNLAYDVKETRPFWHVQLLSIAVTIAGALLVPAAFAMMLLGGDLGAKVAAHVGLEQQFVAVWAWARWPTTAAIVMLAAALAYYFLPDVEQRWRYITPGSIGSTVLWLLGTWGFSRYVDSFGNYNAMYGSIGAVVVLLTWLYVTAVAFVVGGELNAVIEHASPGGKDRGARAPGEAPPPAWERASAAPPGAAKTAAAASHRPPAEPPSAPH